MNEWMFLFLDFDGVALQESHFQGKTNRQLLLSGASA